MKVTLTFHEFNSLFMNNSDCVVIPEWDGNPCYFIKRNDGMCFIFRYGEYEPCTDLMTLEQLYEYVNGDFKLHVQDYKDLF